MGSKGIQPRVTSCLGRKALVSKSSPCFLVSVTQLCLTFCDPMDCSPPGSSAHGVSQVRIQEWVAISFLPIPEIDTWQANSLPLSHLGSPELSLQEAMSPRNTGPSGGWLYRLKKLILNWFFIFCYFCSFVLLLYLVTQALEILGREMLQTPSDKNK